MIELPYTHKTLKGDLFRKYVQRKIPSVFSHLKALYAVFVSAAQAICLS